MKIKINEVNVNYIQYGEGKDILLLHGWGQNIEMMKPIGDNFSDKCRITILDFPGFGQSDEPKEAWTIDDYSNMLEEFVKKLGIKKPMVMGHSFGGRVAINFSSVYNERVKKLLLVDSAGIRPRFSVKKFIAVLRYRIAKRLGKNTDSFGSPDYKALSPLMRKTFVNIVNQNALPSLKNITAQTLIINGEHDDQTPLYMAKKLHKHIKNSALIIFENCGHFAYLEDYLKFIAVSKSFFKE